MSAIRNAVLLTMVAIVAVPFVLPASQAASGFEYLFTGRTVTGHSGIFEMDNVGGGGNTPLGPTPHTWMNATPLAANASLRDAVFSFDLYVQSGAKTVTDPRPGNVTVQLGYVKGTNFTAVGPARKAPVTWAGSTLHVGAGTALPKTSTQVDVGRANGSITIQGILPKDSFRAITITADEQGALVTQQSLIGSSGTSSATVPLPELSGGVLFGVGAACVAGVVLFRRRA